MKAAEIVSRGPGVVSGELVFAGTRVPVQNLIDYPKAGGTLDDFLEGFPGVSREQAEAYLELTVEAAGEKLVAGLARYMLDRRPMRHLPEGTDTVTVRGRGRSGVETR